MIPKNILDQLDRVLKRDLAFEVFWGVARLLAIAASALVASCLLDWVIDRYTETPTGLRVLALVREHVARLFPMEQQEQVTRLLRQDCGAALPCTDNASEEFFERVQCAALKLSEGRVDKLHDAITLAQTDWRDLLVSAWFAEDTQAHKDWNE